MSDYNEFIKLVDENVLFWTTQLIKIKSSAEKKDLLLANFSKFLMTNLHVFVEKGNTQFLSAMFLAKPTWNQDGNTISNPKTEYNELYYKLTDLYTLVVNRVEPKLMEIYLENFRNSFSNVRAGDVAVILKQYPFLALYPSLRIVALNKLIAV